MGGGMFFLFMNLLFPPANTCLFGPPIGAQIDQGTPDRLQECNNLQGFWAIFAWR